MPVSAMASAHDVTTLSTRSSSCGVLSVRSGIRSASDAASHPGSNPGGTSTVRAPRAASIPAIVAARSAAVQRCTIAR